jgi:hypothetical protein
VKNRGGQASPRVEPWRPGDLVMLYLANAFGLVVAAVGWYGSSGTGRFERQAGWTNVAIAGTVVLAVANTVWLMAGRRAVAGRYRRIMSSVASLPLAAVTEHLRTLAPESPAREGALVAMPSMRWYHRPACLCATGKTVVPATRAAHEHAGRAPCWVCHP